MEDAVEVCTAYCFSYPKARSYGPKIPALLSVIGSYIVIREVLANHNLRDRSNTIPRFLLAMSISDMFFSIPYIFTTWAMPPHDNLFQSSGSFATCTIQGASLQLGVSTSPLLNVAISFTALLMIRYQWRTARIIVVEAFLQIVIWSYGLVATIPFIFWGMYNPTSTSCWIASYPHHCGVNETDAIECIRGEGVEFWRAFFAFFPTWPCIVMGLTNMVLIYWTVRKMETRNIRWAHRNSIFHSQTQDVTTAPASSMREFFPVVPNSAAFVPTTPGASVVPSLGLRRENSHCRRKSRAVAIQAILYTCAFLLTFSLDTIVLLWNVLTLKASHLLIVFAYILFPMQGCFNCIVYVRTADLQTPEGRLFRRIFFCWGPLYDTLFGRCRKDEDDSCFEGVNESDPSSGRRQQSSSASSKRHKSSSSAHSRLQYSSNSSAVIGSHDTTVEEDSQQLHSIDENLSNTSRTGSNFSHYEKEEDRQLRRMEEDTPTVSPEAEELQEKFDSGGSLPARPNVTKSVLIIDPQSPRRRTATEETF